MPSSASNPLTSPGPESRAGRRHDIDGLRAAALCGVVLYHAGFGAARGFFVGVDMFFVISGYFITGGLLREAERGTSRIGEFYLRRFSRILPPAAVLCFLCVFPAYFLSAPPDFLQFGKSLLSVLTFTSNHFFASQGGYFDAPLEMNPFLHTWFLSVQGQFYMVFPLIFLLTLWKFPKRIFSVVTVLFFLSLAAGEFSVRYFPTSAYYLLPSRFWELMTGGVASVLSHRGTFRKRRLSPASGEFFSWLSVFSIAVCGFSYSSATPFPGFAAVPVCLGTAVFLVVPEMTARTPFAHRLLSLRPAVFIGTISYSVYLWHWPVFVYAKEYLMVDALSRNARFAAIFLAFVLGGISWALFERKPGSAKGLPALFRLAVLVTPAGLAAVLLAVLLAGDGLPGRFPPEARADIAVLNERTDAYENPVGQISDMSAASADKVRHGGLMRFGGGGDAGGPVFLAWGDSHVYHYRALLEKLARDTGAEGLFLPTPGHPPLAGVYRARLDGTAAQREGYAAVADAAAALVRERRIPVVFLSCYWRFYPETDLTSASPSGEPLTGYPALAAGLRAAAGALTDAGAQIWIVLPTPFYPVSVPRARIRAGADAPALRQTAAEHELKNADVLAVFDALAREFPAVRFIDPLPVLCPDGECLTARDGRPLYFDEHHLSEFGALFLEPAFADFAASLRKHAK